MALNSQKIDRHAITETILTVKISNLLDTCKELMTVAKYYKVNGLLDKTL